LLIEENVAGENGNSPANGRWSLFVDYTLDTEFHERRHSVTFFPNGTIDFTRTSRTQHEIVSAILQPVSMTLQLVLDRPFDIWRLINWMVVSLYWIFLADLGQTSPITYNVGGGYRTLSDTYNIFVNSTLFGDYESFLREIIVPLLRYNLPEFEEIGDNNRLNMMDVTFVRSYSCFERRLKHPLSVLVSVSGIGLSLITALYGAGMFFALIIQEWRVQNSDGSCDCNRQAEIGGRNDNSTTSQSTETNSCGPTMTRGEDQREQERDKGMDVPDDHDGISGLPSDNQRQSLSERSNDEM